MALSDSSAAVKIAYLQGLLHGDVQATTPPSFSAKRQSNALWWAVGLVLSAVNAVRHRLQGYRTPRKFGTEDVGRNVDYCISVVLTWLNSGVDVTGRRVLELGPGPDLGTGAVLLAAGAASYTAVDRFPLASSVDDRYYAELGERLGQPIDRDRLAYSVTKYPEMSDIEGPFDLIVSNAALEHFDDVPATMKRLAELLSPEGVMVHHIDGMTHMRGVRERDPLNLLRYSETLYRMTGFPGIPNRLRASDYVAAARDAGLSAIVKARTSAPEDYLSAVRPGLGRRFRDRSLDDLSPLSFALIASRNASGLPAAVDASEADAADAHQNG